MRVFDSSGVGVVCVGVGAEVCGVCARRLEAAPDNSSAVTTATPVRSAAFRSVLIVGTPSRQAKVRALPPDEAVGRRSLYRKTCGWVTRLDRAIVTRERRRPAGAAAVSLSH